MLKFNTADQRRGYILHEIIVGLVIFGIAMLPVMRAFRMIPRIGSAVGQQSRLEAWRSATDEAILQGIDPTQTQVMHGVTSLEPTSAMLGTVVRRDLLMRVGGPQITAMSIQFSDTAEERAVPAGFEIGPGTIPVPPREDPLPPLVPIKLSIPFLNPLSGTMVPVLSLAPSAVAGAPYTLSLRAEGPASSNLIRLQTRAPEVRDSSGLGSASLEINALQLAQSVRGRAWAEYSGDATVDIPVALGDGRTRWLVRDGSRVQVYEPSDAVEFIFGVDLGRPTYSVGGVEYASGDTVPIDYFQATAVEEGRIEALIAYPADVRERFGAQWGTLAPSFSWSIGRFPGDSSGGNTVSFFRREARAVWTSSQTLAATPSGLAGMRPLGGTWTIQRVATELAPPERIATYYDGSIDAPGWLSFSAPVVTSLKSRIGRPKIDDVESVSESVSVLVLP